MRVDFHQRALRVCLWAAFLSIALPAASYAQSTNRFRILTWNIHHGFTPADSYQFTEQVRLMTASGADVLCLQEVQTWDEDQPARLRTLLAQLTGQSWTVVWAPVNANAGTEGNVVATRLPVSDSGTFQMHATSDYSALLANRSAARARVLVGGASVDIVSTHLDYANTTYRTIQLSQLMAWARALPAPRLIAGDFNSWWGESWITQMVGEYWDTWARLTGNRDGGYTIGGVRFDYIFQSLSGSGITPLAISVTDSGLSDHRPVIADFSMDGSAPPPPAPAPPPPAPAPPPAPPPPPNGPSRPVMFVYGPANGSALGSSFTIDGWAVDLGSGSGVGVDGVNAYAYRNPGSGESAIFLGAAAIGRSRPDVGAALQNSRFTPSGYTLAVSGLAAGVYDLVVTARSTVTNTFNNARTVRITVGASGQGPAMFIDAPSANTNTARNFSVSGWAVDLSAASGTGVDTLHVWAYPNPGSGAAPILVGAVQYGFSRPDVAAAFNRPQFRSRRACTTSWSFSTARSPIPSGRPRRSA
jgi:endonuclease/exonuclease/phosphatase family metal-dependent hydrolase